MSIQLGALGTARLSLYNYYCDQASAPSAPTRSTSSRSNFYSHRANRSAVSAGIGWRKNVHVLRAGFCHNRRCDSVFQLKTGKSGNVRLETQKFEGVALVHVVRAERWGETSNVHLLTHNFANPDTYRCLDSPLCKYAKVTQ